MNRERARAVIRNLNALGGGPVVFRKAAAREIARLNPVDATELIHHLLLLAREGWEPATTALVHFVAALELEAAEIPYADELKRLATVQGLEDVASLFPEGPPAKQMDSGAAAKADAKLFTASLGHLKARARITTNPDELTRLAAASNAAVVRNVLLNPRITEEIVVRIAARRPARPEPLLEIWHCARWSTHHAVRRALVFNPYLPPEIGAKIVPLLSTADLQELTQDRSVHEALRSQAQLLLRPASQTQPTLPAVPNPRLPEV